MSDLQAGPQKPLAPQDPAGISVTGQPPPYTSKSMVPRAIPDRLLHRAFTGPVSASRFVYCTQFARTLVALRELSDFMSGAGPNQQIDDPLHSGPAPGRSNPPANPRRLDAIGSWP